MTRLSLIVAAAAVALAGGAAFANAPDLDRMDVVERAVPNGPVAHVHGVSITRDEYLDLYRSELARVQLQRPNQPVSDGLRVQLGLRTLGTLVERELLYQEGEERGITVSESAVQEEWNAELDRLQHIFAQSPNEQLSEAEILERAGATREQALAELRKALIIERTREAIAEDEGVSVSSEEIQSFFEENRQMAQRPAMLHLKQIYVATPSAQQNPGQMEQARETIQNALARIRSGQTFDAVARSVAESGPMADGGDLGPQPAEQLPPFYVSAAGELEPGGVSNVIESEYGFHIIQLVEREQGEELSLADVEDEIRAFLMTAKVDEAVQRFTGQRLSQPRGIYVYLELDRQLASRPDILQEIQQQP